MSYTPNRMCAVCRQRMPKDRLIRIAKVGDKVIIDDHQGRGAYICHNAQCLQKGINKKILSKITKFNIPEEIYEQLNKKEGN